MTKFQPTLPAPSDLTDQELDFIDSSPPGLFAENQNSNIGALRKVFSDEMADVANQTATLYGERFVFTASQLLADWEQEIGLPIASSLSDTQRRSRIQARRQQGAFTRTKRKQVIEAYLQATFGSTIRLVQAGVPFTASGLQLFSDITSLVGLYTVTENIPNFSYTVSIVSSTAVDASGLQRELARITPAHYNFNITYSGGFNPPQTIAKAGGSIAITRASGTKASNVVANAQRRVFITWGDFVVPDVAGGGGGTSFPTTSVLDNFLRANVGPPPSANWTTSLGTGHKVVSNQMVPNATGYQGSNWNAATFTDPEIYMTLATLSNVANDYAALVVQVDTSNYYEALLTPAGDGTYSLSLSKFVAGVQTALGSTVSGISFSAGDAFGMSVNAGVVTVYKRVAGTWTQQIAVNDSALTGAFQLGMWSKNTAWIFDDFGGGGGVVSGGGGGGDTGTGRRAKITWADLVTP